MSTSLKWFVFQKDLNLPIYIRCNINEFHSNLVAFLSSMKFTELSEKEVFKAEMRMKHDKNVRVLEIRPSSSIVAQQIKFAIESDVYGAESIVPRDGHRVYRYKEIAIILYSFGLSEWVLGCFKDFGTGPDNMAYKCVINRYLSWALAPMGIVGFWGKVTDEGIFVLKQRDSQGESVFLDIQANRAVSSKGIEVLHIGSKVFRRDETPVKGQIIRMQKEQFMSFLMQYTNYLDYSGPSVPIRQAIREITQKLEGGVVYFEDNPKIRTDLPF